MDFKIEPLSKENLEETCKMALESLNNTYKTDFDYAPFWYKASIEPEKYKEAFEKYKTFNLKYWVGIIDDKIIGSTGYYQYNLDKNEAYWLAWYVVDKEFRNKGIGSKLLQFIINKTKKAGKKYLRLYTDSSFKNAHKLYKKFGFKKFNCNYFDKDESKKMLYFELRL